MEKTLGSLFDGIGGFPLAGSRHGIKALWASEIAPFPINVTRTRFPNMFQYGDVTGISGYLMHLVDVITFGSPCTRLSVAGKHDGFDITFECYGDDEAEEPHYKNEIRATDKYQYEYKETCPVCGKELTQTNESALFFHAIRIITEMRLSNESAKHIRPRFAVWENVPGAFSSNKGEDFRQVLEEIIRIAEPEAPDIHVPEKGWPTYGSFRDMDGRWSVAWRVLDAQHWGVPQRRRRIFLVADFGGNTAPEILFKRKGLSRHTAESREAGEGIAADAERGIGKAIGVDVYNFTETGNKAATLNATSGNSSTHSGSSVMQKSYCIQGNCIDRADTAGCNGKRWTEDVCYTLNTIDRPAVMSFTQNQREEVRDLKDKAGALAAEPGVHQQTYLMYESHPGDSRVTGPVDICPTAASRWGTGGNNTPLVQCIEPGALSRGQGERIWDKCPTLRAEMGDNRPCVVLNDQGGSQMDVSENVVGTLRAEMHGNIPAVCAGFNGYKSVTGSIQYQEEKAATLEANMPGNVINCQPSGISGTVSSKWAKGTGGPAGDEHYNLVCSVDCRNLNETDKHGTLQAKENGGQSLNYMGAVRKGYTVRRLTPLECERLQGYPDGWTDIEGASDSGRYKALGNSVAIPCVEFVLEGISEVLDREQRS